ncbi:MAG: FkbM family methyltransferase [Candidatus Curtissbacteria bacterium]|nr:FkbM family methyltransferase [Candidatus Curtissbacteria bacterium]
MSLTSFLSFFWNIIRHTAWISATDSPVSKRDLLLTYLSLKLQYVFLEKIPKRKKKNVKIFGLRLACADLHTVIRLYEEIFIGNIYFFKTKNKKPKIIDCGGHIGMSVAYFKLIYPHSKIVTFEPEKQTFEILKKNVEQNKFKDVRVINRALYARQGNITLYFKDNDPASGTGGLAPRKNYSAQKVPAVTLSKYIRSNLDYLKMDIEGAETNVIGQLSKAKKLKFVKKLTLEYHHHLIPDENKLSKLLTILEKNNFGYLINAYFPSNLNQEKIQDVIIYAYQK